VANQYALNAIWDDAIDYCLSRTGGSVCDEVFDCIDDNACLPDSGGWWGYCGGDHGCIHDD